MPRSHEPPKDVRKPSGPPPKPGDALASVVPPTPWGNASSSKRSRKNEELGAKKNGGRRVPMSGAGRQKGDIRERLALVEDKFTDAESYRIERSTLAKIGKEAQSSHRIPQMRITFKSGTEETWRMVREDDYLALEQEAQK